MSLTQKEIGAIERNIEAAVVSGHFDDARVLLEDYTEVAPAEAKAFSVNIIGRHGVRL